MIFRVSRPIGAIVSFTGLVGLLVVAAGCGGSSNGLDTYPVSGTVTFDGTPIEKGRITFRDASANGRAFSAEIDNGSYELESEAGTMTVTIIASRIIPGKFGTEEGTKDPAGEMYIPKKYNDETTLKAEVTADGDNTFPFDLKSK